MKKVLTLLIAATLFIAAAMMLNSCSQWEPPFEGLDENGNTVSVMYDPCGGIFEQTTNGVMIDVFNYDDVNGSGVKLYAPNDSVRGKNAFNVSREYHSFGGWYVSKTDNDGNLVPDLDKPWDFDNDKIDSSYLTGDVFSSENPVLTLAAYWIPYPEYNIYIPDKNGGFKLHETVKAEFLELPEWTKNGNLHLNSIPKWDNMTFTGAYLDDALETQITDSIYKIDVPLGQQKTTVDIYTTWAEGEWYIISNPDQLITNVSLNGCYYITKDLNFAEYSWPTTFSKGEFTGRFIAEEGKTVTISNISYESERGADMGAALFGNISKDAQFTNVSFENVSYTVNGTNKTAKFGLFASEIDAKAKFENVSISGSLTLANDFVTNLYADKSKFDIGIVSCSGNVGGITLGDITLAFTAPEEILGAVIVLNKDGTVSYAPSGE